MASSLSKIIQSALVITSMYALGGAQSSLNYPPVKTSEVPIPEIVSPKDGEFVNANVVLDWKDIPGTRMYLVRLNGPFHSPKPSIIDTVSDYRNTKDIITQRSKTVFLSQYTPTPKQKLTPGSTYYWFVQAEGKIDYKNKARRFSHPSEKRKFIIKY